MIMVANPVLTKVTVEEDGDPVLMSFLGKAEERLIFDEDAFCRLGLGESGKNGVLTDIGKAVTEMVFGGCMCMLAIK